MVWLFIVLGIVATAAGAFLIYVIYRYKKNEYSRYDDPFAFTLLFVTLHRLYEF